MAAVLVLSEEQRAELGWALRRHPKPYVREKVCALLKLADGELYSTVARTGLLQVHSPDTLHDWVQRYQAEGLKGLLVRPGGGRKPAFPPSAGQRPPARCVAEPVPDP